MYLLHTLCRRAEATGRADAGSSARAHAGRSAAAGSSARAPAHTLAGERGYDEPARACDKRRERAAAGSSARAHASWLDLLCLPCLLSCRPKQRLKQPSSS